MERQTLVIMVKEPRPGRVKTRLAADIGTVAAAGWMRGRIKALHREAASPKWRIGLAVAPDVAVASAMLPSGFRVRQGSGNLGDRMARLFRVLPRGRILIVGADIPDLASRDIDEGFAKLGSHKSVIGPASDGGFWAVGLDTRRPVPPDLFVNVRWSSKHALDDTLTTLPPPAFLRELDDVDCLEDLTRLSR